MNIPFENILLYISKNHNKLVHREKASSLLEKYRKTSDKEKFEELLTLFIYSSELHFVIFDGTSCFVEDIDYIGEDGEILLYTLDFNEAVKRCAEENDKI